MPLVKSTLRLRLYQNDRYSTITGSIGQAYMRRAFYDKRLMTGESDGLDLITPELCIEDWVVAHRAVRNPWIEMKDCIA
jgi:hypothetical protein